MCSNGCRVMLKSYDGVRQQKAVEYRERVAAFRCARKSFAQKTGQEIFATLREVEKSTLAPLGARFSARIPPEPVAIPSVISEPPTVLRRRARRLSLCRILCDAGKRDRDPDRYGRMREIVSAILRSRSTGQETAGQTIDGWINVCDNARVLAGSGTPDESTAEGLAQQERLAVWVRLLEDEQVMENVIASYHVVPLLSEYSPRINAQQLKNALISRAECDRVERMIQDHGRLTPNSLYAAVAKVAGCRGGERAKVAARFLQDFFHYHRDLRRLETLNASMDAVNLVSNEKLRELSRLNGTLYEFRLPEEQQQAEEERVFRHVVLKADVRDSTRLTRTMIDEIKPRFLFQP